MYHKSHVDPECICEMFSDNMFGTIVLIAWFNTGVGVGVTGFILTVATAQRLCSWWRGKHCDTVTHPDSITTDWSTSYVHWRTCVRPSLREPIVCWPGSQWEAVFNIIKVNFDQTAKHLKSQSLIKEAFKKLHQFLQEDEKAVRREEEEQKFQMMERRFEVPLLSQSHRKGAEIWGCISP